MRIYSRQPSNNILIGFFIGLVGAFLGLIVNRNGITHALELIFFFTGALYLGIAIGQARNVRKR